MALLHYQLVVLWGIQCSDSEFLVLDVLGSSHWDHGSPHSPQEWGKLSVSLNNSRTAMLFCCSTNKNESCDPLKTIRFYSGTSLCRLVPTLTNKASSSPMEVYACWSLGGPKTHVSLEKQLRCPLWVPWPQYLQAWMSRIVIVLKGDSSRAVSSSYRNSWRFGDQAKGDQSLGTGGSSVDMWC